MTTPAATLISLACAIAGGSPEAENVASRLLAQDIAQIKEIIASDLCLPENLENVLRETKKKADDGTLESKDRMLLGMPCELCLAYKSDE